MGNRINGESCLQQLVRMAVPLLQKAERECPRTGPGAKPQIPDWVMGVLVTISVLNGKESKTAQYRFLSNRAFRKQLTEWIGEHRFPSRSTFFRRYLRAYELFEVAIRLQGERAIAEGITHPRHLAADKSLIAAKGPPWHKSEQRRGKRKRGTDCEGSWGFSQYHGWVYGYSYEVVVSSTPGETVFPLQASVDSASAAEATTLPSKLTFLPEQVKTISMDAAYDANHLGEQVEWNSCGQRTGRRCLCPENPRNKTRPKRKPGGADKSRARSRSLRLARKEYFERESSRRIYARRSRTVEPFNSWFKTLFNLDRSAWHRGLANNRTQVLAAHFCYQLLVRFNHRKQRPHGRIKWILDLL